jgi:hypothetical protein
MAWPSEGITRWRLYVGQKYYTSKSDENSSRFKALAGSSARVATSFDNKETKEGGRK